MEDKKILVLLACYNGEDYIDEQISSIFNQNNCSIFLFISDDCSTDNTIRKILSAKKKYKNIKLIQNTKNLGFSSNFYNLVCKATNLNDYDYVAFSDQDDIFIQNKFSKQILNFCNLKYVGQSSSVKCFGNSNKILSQSSSFTNYDFLFEGAGQGCTFLLKINFFKDFRKFIISNFDLVSKFIFHDWLCYLYARSKGYEWYIDNDVLLRYRIHGINSFGNKYSFSGILLRLKKLFSGWYYDQVCLAFIISKKVNSNFPNFDQVSFFRFICITLFNGRRRLPDRWIAFLFLFPFFIKNKL